MANNNNSIQIDGNKIQFGVLSGITFTADPNASILCNDQGQVEFNITNAIYTKVTSDDFVGHLQGNADTATKLKNASAEITLSSDIARITTSGGYVDVYTKADGTYLNSNKGLFKFLDNINVAKVIGDLEGNADTAKQIAASYSSVKFNSRETNIANDRNHVSIEPTAAGATISVGSGVITFSQLVKATFEGNLKGNITGNLTGLSSKATKLVNAAENASILISGNTHILDGTAGNCTIVTTASSTTIASESGVIELAGTVKAKIEAVGSVVGNVTGNAGTATQLGTGNGKARFTANRLDITGSAGIASIETTSAGTYIKSNKAAFYFDKPLNASLFTGNLTGTASKASKLVNGAGEVRPLTTGADIGTSSQYLRIVTASNTTTISSSGSLITFGDTIQAPTVYTDHIKSTDGKIAFQDNAVILDANTLDVNTHIEGNSIHKISGFGSVENSIWNDIADLMEVEDSCEVEAGYVYHYDRETKTHGRTKNSKNVFGICSDTYGFAMGAKPENIKTIPIAVGGFVLAHIYKDRKYETGTPLQATFNGNLIKASLFTKLFNPQRIIATYYKAEDRVEWYEVIVNERSWVKVI